MDSRTEGLSRSVTDPQQIEVMQSEQHQQQLAVSNLTDFCLRRNFVEISAETFTENFISHLHERRDTRDRTWHGQRRSIPAGTTTKQRANELRTASI